MHSTYIVIAHGSREQKANEQFETFLEKFREAYPKKHIEGAFLELAKPSIPEAIKTAVENGTKEIFMLPMMFFQGRHVQKDIPSQIEEAKALYPEVDFHFAAPLSESPLLMELLNDQAEGLKKVLKK